MNHHRNSSILGLMTAALLMLALAVLGGCRSQDEASADSGNPAAMTPSAARAAIQDVTIGHQLAADGTISTDQKGNTFSQGQPVIIAFGIGKAPVGTPVNVDWFGPDNQPVASDQQNVATGERTMSFTSKDTAAWGQGDYHADVAVGGQKVDTERFSIAAPDNQAAGKESNSDKAVADVSVGHQLGADGAIAAGQDGKHFMPGDPIFIAFKTGGAPAGTAIEIDWMGPQDQRLGSETRQVTAGDSMMHFSTRRTSGWGLGDYHADLLVNGQKVDTEHFSIVNANHADQSGQPGR
jgi:hypothetical protein